MSAARISTATEHRDVRRFTDHREQPQAATGGIDSSLQVVLHFDPSSHSGMPLNSDRNPLPAVGARTGRRLDYAPVLETLGQQHRKESCPDCVFAYRFLPKGEPGNGRVYRRVFFADTIEHQRNRQRGWGRATGRRSRSLLQPQFSRTEDLGVPQGRLQCRSNCGETSA
jgi:hypothetical protein